MDARAGDEGRKKPNGDEGWGNEGRKKNLKSLGGKMKGSQKETL